jgi:DNA replication protein DnaC
MRYLIEQTLKELEKKRLHAQNKAEHSKNKIYSEIKELEVLDKKISELGIESLLLLHLGDFSNKKEIFNQIESFKEQKKTLLKKHKYNEEDYWPKYSCSLCNDTGMINDEYCICLKQSVAAKLYGQTALESVLEKENFETFNLELFSNRAPKGKKSPRKNMEKIYEECVLYTKNFNKDSENLFFTGSTGVGKTFMINCVVADLLKKGIYIIYMISTDLIDLLRKSRLSEYSATIDSSFVEALYTCDLLIIDDLGTENATDFAIDELFNLLNKRLLANKQIIISTNLTLDELEDMYSIRIFSRIMGSFKPYEFLGNDIRIKLN